MLNKFTLVSSLIAILLHTPMVFAQTTVFELDPLVIYADENETNLFDKLVIKQKALKTHKVVEITEVLADELVQVSLIRKSGYGNEVGLRGFTKSNLRFTQDDTLIEGSCGSRKDPPLSHINMLTVKSMEVKEGPYDVTVPGALGGNINVITKDPQQGFHSQLFSKFGSFGFLSQGLYVTGGSQGIQGLLGYNYATSDQYEDGGGRKLSDANPGYSADGQNRPAFEKHDFWGKVLLKPGETQELLLASAYGQAHDILTPRVGMDTETEKSFLNKISYTINNLSALSKQLKLSAYYNRIEHYPYGQFRTGPVSQRRIEAISYIAGAQIENQTPSSLALFTYGTDFYFRNWYGDVIHRDTGAVLNDELFPNVNELNLGLYLKAEKDFDKLTLTAGMRVDRFQTEALEMLKNSIALTDTNAQTNLYPSGYIFGKYFINDQTTIFGGTGVTARTPTTLERYTQQGPGFYGNPDLHPAHNFESGLGMESQLFNRFTFKAKAFYSTIQNFIYQTTIPAKTWTNIDAFITGGDLNASLLLGYGFSLDGGLAYQRGQKLTQPEGNQDKDLAEIPPLKIKSSINYEHQGLQAVFEWVHSEDHVDVDSDGGETELDGWDVLNFRASYRFAERPGKTSFLDGVSLNVGINNILDSLYTVANSYEYDPTDPGGSNVKIISEPGRFIYGSLTYQF